MYELCQSELTELLAVPTNLEDYRNSSPNPDSDDPDSEECVDGELKYKGKGKKDCDWLAKKKSKKICEKKENKNGSKVYTICKETCGEVGLGPCDSTADSDDGG